MTKVKITYNPEVEINWFSFVLMLLGIGVSILGALNENINGFQFVGGFMFGVGLATIKRS